MTWCKLQDTGVTILCYFDSATNQANATNCALFAQETLSTLGTGPNCYWVNPSTVGVDLGNSATITFNVCKRSLYNITNHAQDKISIGAGVVRGQGSDGQPNQAVSVALQRPDNPVHPVASIAVR